MFKLINFFVDLCFLRRAPQDLPGSSGLLVLLALANLAITTIAVSGLVEPGVAFTAAIVDMLLMLLVFRLALMIQKRGNRWLQTVTAVFGCSIIIGLISLPVQLAIDQGGDSGNLAALASIAYLALLIWSQLVMGHILRHALDVSLALGIGLALAYSLLSGAIIQNYFITPAT